MFEWCVLCAWAEKKHIKVELNTLSARKVKVRSIFISFITQTKHTTQATSFFARLIESAGRFSAWLSSEIFRAPNVHSTHPPARQSAKYTTSCSNKSVEKRKTLCVCFESINLFVDFSLSKRTFTRSTMNIRRRRKSKHYSETEMERLHNLILLAVL